MALNQRERILAWGAGSVLSLAMLQFSYGYVQSLFDERQTQIDALKREVSDKKSTVDRGLRADKKLKGWQERSLPTDVVLARSLYKNWLARLIERTRLAKGDVTLGADIPKPGIYVKVPVNVRGQGTMEQVVQFLFDFYQANHLHYIRQLTLTPMAKTETPAEAAGAAALSGGGEGGEKQGGPSAPDAATAGSAVPRGPFGGRSFGGLGGRSFGGFGGGLGGGMGGFGRGGGKPEGQKYELVAAIEALILPGASHSDKLNDQKAERLAYSDVDSYRKTITERNFFAPYTPQSDADPAADTFVTAVVKKEGKYQVWINLRSSGKTLKLSEGETFDLGNETATIARIEPHKVNIKTDSFDRDVALGKSVAGDRSRRGGWGRGGRRGFSSGGPPMPQ